MDKKNCEWKKFFKRINIMNYLKLYEQFNEDDPFGEEFNDHKYFFVGSFYVSNKKLPEDNYIKRMLKGNRKFLEYDYNITEVKITNYEGPPDFYLDNEILITIKGNLEIKNKNYNYRGDDHIINILKDQIKILMKEITSYENIELEDFGLGIERK
jgi:hypothetical protein